MQSVLIKKDGFYGVFWDGETRTESVRKLDDEETLWGLRSGVDIEDGVTLRDIVRAVDANKPLTMFLGLYNQCNGIEKHNDCILNVPYEGEPTDLTRLEVGWYSRFWDFGDYPAELELWTDAYGIGPKEDGEGEGEEHYGIDLTPGNKLADLPVTLNRTVKMWMMPKKGEPLPGEGVLLDEGVKHHYVQGEHYFSLLDVLDALYEELSFFGPPGGRDEIVQGLQDTMDEMKAQIEEGEALPAIEGENGTKVYMSDQVRGFLGLPSNVEDRDDQIRRSAEED